MGLRVQRSRFSGEYIVTFFAVFALMLQPMYGLVQGKVAEAASAASHLAITAGNDQTLEVGQQSAVLNVQAQNAEGAQTSVSPAVDLEFTSDKAGVFNGGALSTGTCSTGEPTKRINNNQANRAFCYTPNEAGLHTITVSSEGLTSATATVNVNAPTPIGTVNNLTKNTNHVTINEAIEAAQAGDTIQVAAGTYVESLNINKSVKLVGAGQGVTIIKAPAAFGNGGDLIAVSGSGTDVEISNLTISGKSDSLTNRHAGLHVFGGANINVHDVTVTDIRTETPTSRYVYAILIGDDSSSSTAATATISNATITEYQRGGIYVSGAGTFATITNNTVTAPTVNPGVTLTNGILVQYGANAVITGNTVTGNKYNPTTYSASGIALWDNTSSATVVSGNTVTANDVGIGVITDSPAALENLDIAGATDNIAHNAVAYPENPYDFYPPWSEPSEVFYADIKSYSKDQIVMHEGKARVVGYNLVKDTIDPEVPVLVKPVAGSHIGAKADFEFTVKDNESGMKQFNVHLLGDGETKQIISLEHQDGDTWGAYGVELTIPDGVYSIVSRAQDNAGNTRVGSGTTHGKVTVDKEAPTLKVNLNRTSYAKSGDFVSTASNPEYEARDTNLDRIEIWKGDKLQHNISTDQTQRRGQLKHLKNGTYIIRAYDKASNVSEDFELKIDSDVPTVNFITKPAYVNAANFKFNLEATDATSGVKNWSMIFLNDNGQDMRIGSVPCSPQTLGNNASATCYANADLNKFESGKTYTVRATTTDKANNKGTSEHTFMFDSEKAQVDVDVAEYNPTNFKITASDDASGVASVTAILRQTKAANGKEVATSCSKTMAIDNLANFEATCDMPADLENGQYNIRFNITDAAGNFLPTQQVNFTKDTKAPVVTLNGATGAVNTDVNIVASIFDENLSHYYLSITKDGKPIKNGTTHSAEFSDQTLATLTQEGDYVVKLEARDKAGNKDANDSVKTISFTIDKTAPEVAITAAILSEDRGVYTISGTTEDGIVPVVTLGGEELERERMTIDGDTWTVTVPASELTHGQTYTVVATVADAAGNTSTSAVEGEDGEKTDFSFVANFEQSEGDGDKDTESSAGGAGTGPDDKPADQGRAATSDESTLIIQGVSTQGTTTPLAATTLFLPFAASTVSNESNQVGEVLGAQNTDNTTIENAPKATVEGEADEAEGLSFLGLAWYWWLLILAAVAAGLWWLIAAIRRKKDEQANQF